MKKWFTVVGVMPNQDWVAHRLEWVMQLECSELPQSLVLVGQDNIGTC